MTTSQHCGTSSVKLSSFLGGAKWVFWKQQRRFRADYVWVRKGSEQVGQGHCDGKCVRLQAVEVSVCVRYISTNISVHIITSFHPFSILTHFYSGPWRICAGAIKHSQIKIHPQVESAVHLSCMSLCYRRKLGETWCDLSIKWLVDKQKINVISCFSLLHIILEWMVHQTVSYSLRSTRCPKECYEKTF